MQSSFDFSFLFSFLLSFLLFLILSYFRPPSLSFFLLHDWRMCRLKEAGICKYEVNLRDDMKSFLKLKKKSWEEETIAGYKKGSGVGKEKHQRTYEFHLKYTIMAINGLGW